MKLTKRQRENVAKTLFDICKLVAGILILGPVVSPGGFRLSLFITGFIIFLILFFMATLIDKGE